MFPKQRFHVQSATPDLSTGNPATENGRASAHSDADTDRNSDLAMSSLT